MSRTQQLAERRAVLVDRLARQRLELGNGFSQLERQGGVFDKGFALAQRIRAHPKLALATGLLAILLLRKRVSAGMFTGAALAAAKTGISLVRMLLPRQADH